MTCQPLFEGHQECVCVCLHSMFFGNKSNTGHSAHNCCRKCHSHASRVTHIVYSDLGKQVAQMGVTFRDSQPWADEPESSFCLPVLIKLLKRQTSVSPTALLHQRAAVVNTSLTLSSWIISFVGQHISLSATDHHLSFKKWSIWMRHTL